MKNYVYIYFNNGMREGVTPEDFQKEWGDWFALVGDKLVDAGNPFNKGGKKVKTSGVSDVEGGSATGYSIVKADSMDAAVEFAKSCPILKEPEGALKVFETMPM